jgi:hypothetical protein
MSVLPYVMHILSEWMGIYEVIHMDDDDDDDDDT